MKINDSNRRKSPIFFLIRFPYFLCNEFLLRCMDFYKITPSKSVPFQRKRIFVVYTIF